MNNYLTDEDIHALDESSEEEKEIIKLKQRLINDEELIEIQSYVLDKILIKLQTELKSNLKKTKQMFSAPTVKAYREELLFLRDIEKQMKIYTDYKEKNK